MKPIKVVVLMLFVLLVVDVVTVAAIPPDIIPFSSTRSETMCDNRYSFDYETYGTDKIFFNNEEIPIRLWADVHQHITITNLNTGQIAGNAYRRFNLTIDFIDGSFTQVGHNVDISVLGMGTVYMEAGHLSGLWVGNPEYDYRGRWDNFDYASREEWMEEMCLLFDQARIK